MSATNSRFPIADPLGTRRPDPKVRSRSKSTSSSEGQPRAITSPRRTRLMHDLRSGRGQHMTKTSTSRSNREARSSHAMMMQIGADSQRSHHSNVYLDRVHRGIRLSCGSDHDSCHVRRRAEVKDSYGVIHGGKALISV
ncbi:hypothetical protein GW17_00044516 [Ensete ventricosum]|nr:hypothetical protein GW17_00044516 [Ensete ventricosum]